MAKAPVDIRSLARQHTLLALNTLAAIARGSDNDAARVAASNSLLDRGFGKVSPAFAGDEDGEGKLQIIVRHIIESGVEPVTIDGLAGRALNHRPKDAD